MTDRGFFAAAGLTFLSLLAVGLSTATGNGASVEAPATGQVTAIVGAKVFDGEEFRNDVAIVIAGETIVKVGAATDVPDGAVIIDARGKTVIPGLIDSHVHAFGTALEDSLQFGVTTVLDMFSDHHQAATWRAEQAAGESSSRADVFSAGTLVTAAGGHGTQFGLNIPTIASAGEAEAFVSARVAEGSDFIKIVLEDGALSGRPLATLDEPTLQAVVAEAHAREKLAVAHVSTLDKARQALDAGVDGLVHLFYDEPADASWLAEASSQGLFVVPTLTILESASGGAGGSTLVADDRLAPYLSAQAAASLKRVFPRQTEPAGDGTFGLARSNLRALQETGITILAGTDAPNPGTWYGVSMHRELELLVDAGLSPAQALRAATSTPADVFGMSDRGRIVAGRLADLLLIEGDLEEDILTTRAIAGIWRRGQIVMREPKTLETPATRSLLEPGLVDDFESGATWPTSTDEMMGGKSTVEVLVVEGGAPNDAGDLEARDSGRALVIQGVIAAADFPFPWAGAMYFPGAGPMEPVNASALSELVFWAKGDGSRQRVMFFAESLGRIPGQASFIAAREWTEVVISFEAVSGMDPRGLAGILFSGPLTPGEFAFAIDQVGFR